MKKLILFSLFALSFSFISANDNQKAIEYFTFGLTNPSKEILLNNLKTGTLSPQQQAEAYYYLGEIYFLEQKKDSALYYYQQAPDYVFNIIGQAKLNINESEKTLSDIASKNKKDMAVQYAVIKAYLDNNLIEKASQKIAEAKKANPTSPYILTLEGNIFAKNKEYGKAVGAYEQAIYFDSKFKEPYVKIARIYANSNMASAIDAMQRLLSADPTSFLPYRETGEIYYENNRFADAVKAYTKYMDNEKYVSSDYPKYASMLFFSGDFNKSMEITEKGLKEDPNNLVLNRLLMYNLYELKKHPEGLAHADNFMKKERKEFIALDHIYHARLLIENKQREEAIAQYQKALELDLAKISIYKEMAEVYELLEQYDKAIENYNKFIANAGNQVTVADYFLLGQTYYSASTATTNAQQKNEYARTADSIFAYVAEKTPNSYLGNFWRARTNTMLDPETEQGLAKPYYEAAILLLNKDNARDVKPLIECYRYLGYYYYLKNDVLTSKQYWNNILELDPKNETAINALREM